MWREAHPLILCGVRSVHLNHYDRKGRGVHRVDDALLYVKMCKSVQMHMVRHQFMYLYIMSHAPPLPLHQKRAGRIGEAAAAAASR